MVNEEQKGHETEEAERRTAPSGRIVYKTILNEGNEELRRSTSALFWSGLAAGLSMGFSMIGQAFLSSYLPDAHWRPLVAKFGYSLGFLIVILGRQQLFTENTLTPILPLLVERSSRAIRNVGRLWLVVLTANLLGGLAIAWVAANSNAFEPSIREEFVRIGEEALKNPFGTVLLRGIFAGWLIALMVWLLPFAETSRIWVIIIITYFVGLGDFSHIIVGSIETFTFAAMGHASWNRVIVDYVVPTFLGNTIGGLTLVAALNHAQVVSGTKGQDL
jgi:formate/nitrite transporter FocA (FNT family)